MRTVHIARVWDLNLAEIGAVNFSEGVLVSIVVIVVINLVPTVFLEKNLKVVSLPFI